MIRIGLLATLIGPYRIMAEDGVRGAHQALAEFDYQVAGQTVELIVRETSVMGNSAVDAALDLLDHEGCDVIIGPLSGDEGVAIRELARQRPEYVFINGTSASQALFNPAANFFSFIGSGAQWMAGFGRYCYEVKGYRNIATIGQGYSFPFAQVGGFGLEFCAAGGEINQMIWTGLGAQDFTVFVDQISDDADAVLSVLAGPDFAAFVQAYRQRQRETPIIVGQASGDIIALENLRDYADWMVGLQMAGPAVTVNPSPAWNDFVHQYRDLYPDGHYAPSMYCLSYYVAIKAAMLALEAVDGDLSGEQARLKQALAVLEFETPTGPVRLDHHHLAIVNNFVGEIDVTSDGIMFTRLVETISGVNCTLGLSDEDYLRMGDFNAHNMPCQYEAHRPDSFESRLRQRKQHGSGT